LAHLKVLAASAARPSAIMRSTAFASSLSETANIVDQHRAPVGVADEVHALEIGLPIPDVLVVEPVDHVRSPRGSTTSSPAKAEAGGPVLKALHDWGTRHSVG
jgi:hypothetical protein